MMFNKKSLSRTIAGCLSALVLTTFGGVIASAEALPETPYYFDAEYICNGTCGESNKPAHEYWRHSVAELTEEDGVTCLKMVAAADDKYPTQVNVYWADKDATEAEGAINLEKYPYMLMSYKTTLAAAVDLPTCWNTVYYNDAGTTEAGDWNVTVLNFDPAKINKGTFQNLTSEVFIRFFGETPSKEYVGAEFYLEYVAFFRTEADALAFAEAKKNSANTANETAVESSAQTDDGIYFAVAALLISAGGALVFKRRRAL
ncbi:MAG: hypothetical protein HFE63_04900 [Clostridiales bacterium]|nr:hypothetical protein [Clostridiales bacterium]